MKTKIMKAICLCLALVLCFGNTISVSAAEVAGATIDETQKGSLTIFKYDLTNSENDGVWDSSYVSTGVADESGVNETMKNYALQYADSLKRKSSRLHSPSIRKASSPLKSSRKWAKMAGWDFPIRKNTAGPAWITLPMPLP